jgi:assimilatory nitrate reductase catalytic subunit
VGRALAHVATRIRVLQAEHGPDAVAVFGAGGLTNEKAYLLGKFARVALGTSQIDDNGRFCMASAAAAGNRAANLLTNPALDPVSRMPEFKLCAVRLEPA